MKTQFADRMSHVKKSFIREILKVTVNPELISFAGSLPNPASFPVEEISEAARKVLCEDGGNALQYSTTEGYLPLRRKIAERYDKRFGLKINAEEIMITTGSQQALDLIGKAFLNKGDPVLAYARRQWGNIFPGAIKTTHATAGDIDSWMKLVRRMRNLFPGLETEQALSDHRKTVLKFMNVNGAICAKDRNQIVGTLLFSPSENVLCYLAVDDRYQRRHIAQKLVSCILSLTDPEKDITVTTYREDDPNGTAARAFYQHLGFEPGALTEEFGSPVQVFTLKRQSLS